jgi:hypothetical protein
MDHALPLRVAVLCVEVPPEHVAVHKKLYSIYNQTDVLCDTPFMT